MKRTIISFAHGKEAFLKSQQNLFEQINLYSIIGKKFNKSDIDINFLEKNKEIFSNSRGFGYWLWKPYFILKTLEEMDYGDVCMYCDAGNSLISDPSPLFNLCKEVGGILLFENRDGNYDGNVWRNLEWTKYDCYTLMGCTKNIYVNGSQVDASYSLWEKKDNVINFLKEYLNFCENINIISDLPNITGDNHYLFKDHRHDQSILSLLAIKYGIKLYPEPSEWGNKWRKDSDPYKQIFWHHRGSPFI